MKLLANLVAVIAGVIAVFAELEFDTTEFPNDPLRYPTCGACVGPRKSYESERKWCAVGTGTNEMRVCFTPGLSNQERLEKMCEGHSRTQCSDAKEKAKLPVVHRLLANCVDCLQVGEREKWGLLWCTGRKNGVSRKQCVVGGTANEDDKKTCATKLRYPKSSSETAYIIACYKADPVTYPLPDPDTLKTCNACTETNYKLPHLTVYKWCESDKLCVKDFDYGHSCPNGDELIGSFFDCPESAAVETEKPADVE